MLSFNRFISIIGITIFMVACNANAMEDSSEAEDYGRVMPFFGLQELTTFVGDKINDIREGITTLYELINGEAFDIEIAVDEKSLELIQLKLTEKHRAP